MNRRGFFASLAAAWAARKVLPEIPVAPPPTSVVTSGYSQVWPAGLADMTTTTSTHNFNGSTYWINAGDVHDPWSYTALNGASTTSSGAPVVLRAAERGFK